MRLCGCNGVDDERQADAGDARSELNDEGWRKRRQENRGGGWIEIGTYK
jgi:hypothetical protein